MLGIANKDLANAIGTPALLEQCAEECSELSQACLKMSRKLRDENPTPKSIDEIRNGLIEELSDVLLCMDYVMHCCNIDFETDIKNVIVDKQIRWINRYNEQINEEGE